MKSLWSKAGLAHRCGCRSCSTVMNGAGRRVTAPRRKPTFAEIFTAAYSSVFASAAIVDAVRKDERRKDLDLQLEDARRDLAKLREQNGSDDLSPESLESGLSNLSETQMDELWRSLKNIYKGRPHFKEIHKPATLKASELREKLQLEHYGCADEASMARLRQTNLERLEKAMILEETELSISRRDPKGQAQMRRLSDSILALVEQMMSRAETSPNESRPCPSFDEAAKLMDTGFPRYTYRIINPRRARDNTNMLNSANRCAIHDPELGLKEKVGRVCYNLLISAYPPDMHTLNTLIAAFDKHRGYRHFSEAVVSTFFYNSRLLPTPSTYVAILHHYKVTGNHGRFLRAIACIAGLDQKTGAKYRRRDIGEFEDNVRLQDWATDTKRRTLGGDYVWEHAPLNRLIVEEILSGLLRFHMFDHAMAFFSSCMRAGVHITSRVVKQVLDECLVALDWKAAVQLVRDFSKGWGMWSFMLMSRDDNTVAYLIDRVYSLLDMIGLGISGESLSDQGLSSLGISRQELATFVGEVSMTNLTLPAALVVSQERGDVGAPGASKSRLLQMESLDKELTRVRKTVKSQESRLLKPDLPLEFRTSMAMHICGTAIEAAQRLGEEVSYALRVSRRVLVEAKEEEKKAAGTVDTQTQDTKKQRRPMPARAVAEAPKQERPLRIRRQYDDFWGDFAARRTTMAGLQEHRT